MPRLLQDRGWTIDELERQLRARGTRIDRRTLDRLRGDVPVGRTDVGLIRDICDLLGVGLDDFFRFAPALPNGEPDEYWQAPEASIARARELASRNNAGTISPEEHQELS